MADRRMEFSLSAWQALLLLTASATTLLLVFIFGVMVGKGEIEGLKAFDREVRSDVVKMKIESAPPDQPFDRITSRQEEAAIIDNTGSKPVITFYDTLAKPGNNRKETLPIKNSNDSLKVYTIQVGAMKDKALADAMVSKLKTFGYSAYIATSESSGKTWHKVRLGTFSSREDARREAARVEKNEGMSATVVEK